MAQFNVGEDCRITVVGPYGNLSMPQTTSVSYTVAGGIVQSQDLNGNTNSRTVMKGVTGTITVDRSTNELDTLVATMYRNWKAGVPIPQGQIVSVISELDNSETTHSITEVSFVVKDLGSWKPGAKVTQTIQFVGNTFQ